MPREGQVTFTECSVELSQLVLSTNRGALLFPFLQERKLRLKVYTEITQERESGGQ